MDVRKILLPFGFLVMTMIVAGIALRPHNKNETPEQLAETAFRLIRKGDWENYKFYVITWADIWQSQNQEAPEPGRPLKGVFSKNFSYANKVLKPEQMEMHRALFERAQEGAEGMIDFAESKFLGLGSLISEGPFGEDMGIHGVTTQTWSLLVKVDGEEIDTKDLFPQLVIIPWKDEFRVLGLEGKGVAEFLAARDPGGQALPEGGEEPYTGGLEGSEAAEQMDAANRAKARGR